MPGVKCTFQFSNDKYSWSEAHYWITGQTPTFQAAIAPAEQLGVYRIPLLGNGAQLNRIRLSLFPANRQVYDILYPGAQGAPVWPADPTGLVYSSSRSFTALLARLQDVGGSWANVFAAGVPASLAHSVAGDTTGLQWGSCPGFSTRWGQFVNFLTNGNWGWLSRRDTTFAQAQALVTNAAFPSMIGVQTAAAIPQVGVGSQVLVKGFRRLNTRLQPLGGVWTVGGVLAPVAPAVNWTYFLLNSGNVSTTNYKGMGQIGLLYQDFHIYASVWSIDITERKRGGSIGRPRGRSRMG